MKKRFDLNLNQKIGQCRAIPVRYNSAEHILIIYGADFDVDPYEEMFYFPQDTLKMAMVTLEGEVLGQKP